MAEEFDVQSSLNPRCCNYRQQYEGYIYPQSTEAKQILSCLLWFDSVVIIDKLTNTVCDRQYLCNELTMDVDKMWWPRKIGVYCQKGHAIENKIIDNHVCILDIKNQNCYSH